MWEQSAEIKGLKVQGSTFRVVAFSSNAGNLSTFEL